jgi:hypothetical protein
MSGEPRDPIPTGQTCPDKLDGLFPTNSKFCTLATFYYHYHWTGNHSSIAQAKSSCEAVNCSHAQELNQKFPLKPEP